MQDTQYQRIATLNSIKRYVSPHNQTSNSRIKIFARLPGKRLCRENFPFLNEGLGKPDGSRRILFRNVIGNRLQIALRFVRKAVAHPMPLPISRVLRTFPAGVS
jgi:hypothetical protein